MTRYLYCLIVILFSGCASRSIRVTAEEPPGNLRLFTPNGIGHGCLTTKGFVTANHVIHPSEIPLSNILHGVTWSDRYGREGTAVEESVSIFSDVAFLRIQGEAPEAAKIGPRALPGDRVSWIEYNFANPSVALKPIKRYSEVVHREAGHYTLKESPEHGASGGCVYDSEDRVIGIVVWGFSVTRPDDAWVGVIYAIEE